MSGPGEIWVIDDDQSIRWVLERALGRAGFKVEGFDGGSGVHAQLRQREPDAIVSDIRMPDVDGLELLGDIKSGYPHLPVIIMTGYSDLDSAVSAYQGGAYEYLPKPFDIDEAVALVKRAVAHNRENAYRDSAPAPGTSPGIIGSAPAMQEVFRAVGRLSRSNLTVLITGESGSGKELVARALHRHGLRASRAFIALNTAAIPRELLESELFGHERGAFTGAQSRRLGRFEQADGGTLFLDEIGDMPAELQTRLLRVLADGEFYRVGGHLPVRVDVRIIAATHQDLEARVRAGTFREDLFHRLNVIRVHSPSLRDRRADIPLLLAHYLERAASEITVEPKTLKPEVVRYLETLDWPGNVRQLENACRWLTVMAPGNEIHLEDLPPELRGAGGEAGDLMDDWEASLRRWAERRLGLGDGALVDDAMPKFETVLIRCALGRTGGRRQEAAKLLGWGRNTLTRKIKELALDL